MLDDKRRVGINPHRHARLLSLMGGRRLGGRMKLGSVCSPCIRHLSLPASAQAISADLIPAPIRKILTFERVVQTFSSPLHALPCS